MSGMVMKGRAVGTEWKRFVRVLVVSDVVRFVGFIAALIALRVARPAAFETVALAAVAGVIVFVVGEVWYVVRAS